MTDVKKLLDTPEDCELAELKKTIVNLEKTLDIAKEKLNKLECKQKVHKNKVKKDPVEVKYIRTEDFIDPDHYLHKYIDTKNNWSIGYYRPEVCYNRMGERISKEELLDMLNKVGGNG